jgi:hypothetical protein
MLTHRNLTSMAVSEPRALHEPSKRHLDESLAWGVLFGCTGVLNRLGL